MEKLFSGSLLVFLGLLLRAGFLLVFELVAARHLGPASYGTFSLAFTVVVVASHLPVLCLQISLRRFISLHLARGQVEEVRGLTMFGLVWPAALGILFGGLLFVGSERLSTDLFGKSNLAPVLKALALVVPLWSTRRLATVIFSGYTKPLYKVGLEDFLEPLLRVVAAITVAIAGWGALQLGYGTLAAYVVVGAVAWSLVLRGRREVVGAESGFRIPWRKLLWFSTPLIVSELVDLILAWVNILLLGILSTNYEVGLFRSASQPPMLASATLTSFGFIFLPTATALFARRDHAGWKRTNNAVARWTLSLAFPVGAMCLLFSDELIQILFGPEYRGGALSLQLLGAGALLHAGCGFTGLNLMIAGHTRIQMAGSLLSLVTNVGASVLLIPEYGATGAAAAVFVAVVFRNLFNLVFMGILLRLCPFTGKYLAVLGVHLASVAILAGGAHLLELPRLVAMLALGVLELPLAVSLGLLTGVFRAADLDLIKRFRNAEGERDVG
jgi:O-antigen/teichoic acid export membrane protein